MTIGKTYQFKSDGTQFRVLSLDKKDTTRVEIEYLNATTKKGRRWINPSKNTEYFMTISEEQKQKIREINVGYIMDDHFKMLEEHFEKELPKNEVELKASIQSAIDTQVLYPFRDGGAYLHFLQSVKKSL